MSELPEVDGMSYLPEDIEQLRHELVTMRNQAMDAGMFHQAVVMSHAIALLAHLAEMVRAARRG